MTNSLIQIFDSCTIEKYKKNILPISFSTYLQDKQTKIQEDLENELLSLIPQKSKYLSQFPVCGRGIPRLFHRQDPSFSIMKKNFSDSFLMKRKLLEKMLLPFYNNSRSLPAKIVLLTWVVPGGLGDYYAQLQIAKILKKTYPWFDLLLVTILMDSHVFPSSDFPCETVLYHRANDQGVPMVAWKQEILSQLRNSQLILQIPTYFPGSDDLIEKLHHIPSNHPFPRMEIIEEYGFIESEWFHPPNTTHSMGLHFLELGILTKEIEKKKATWIDLQNKFHLSKKNRNFFAYLITKEGSLAYLFALLTYLEEDNKDITVLITDIAPLLLQREQLFSQKEMERYHIKELTIEAGDFCQTKHFAKKGKILRIVHTGKLLQEQVHTLLVYLEDFVGCRGDQSFSEAVSANKIYFYDGLMHSSPFLKNLLSLAKVRLENDGKAIEYLTLLWQLVCSYWEKDPREWVEEEFFVAQEKTDPKEIGKKIGCLLKDPSCIEGIKKFNQLLQKECSFAPFLGGLINRELMFYHSSDFEIYEKKQLLQTLEQKMDFDTLITNILRKMEKSDGREKKSI